MLSARVNSKEAIGGGASAYIILQFAASMRAKKALYKHGRLCYNEEEKRFTPDTFRTNAREREGVPFFHPPRFDRRPGKNKS